MPPIVLIGPMCAGKSTIAVLATNAHFVRHPSNRRLAKATFYTAGYTPEQTTDAITKWLAAL
jgi:hypothetical protein